MDYFISLGLTPVTPVIDANTEDLAALPIGGFHEKPKGGKDPAKAYAPTVIDRKGKVSTTLKVARHYAMTVGTSYRSHCVAVIVEKIATARGCTAEQGEQLRRVIAWTGRISHEGGSLGGFTPAWATFWSTVDALIQPHAVMGIYANGTFKVFPFKKKAQEDEDVVKTLNGVDAVVHAAKALLKPEETALSRAEWTVFFRTRIVSRLMSKLESGKGKLHHADIMWHGVTLRELALLTGVLARGSKGIIAQSWNLAEVVAGGANFAKQLEQDVIDRAFPDKGFAWTAATTLKKAHVRVHALAVKREQEREQRQLVGMT